VRERGEGEGEGTNDNLLVLDDGLLVVSLVLGRLKDLDPVLDEVGEDPRLECRDLVLGHRVCLCDDGNEVDLRVQSTHELHVHGLEATDPTPH
jgi:hypothetical protein